jgi:hypothetical protein
LLSAHNRSKKKLKSDLFASDRKAIIIMARGLNQLPLVSALLTLLLATSFCSATMRSDVRAENSQQFAKGDMKLSMSMSMSMPLASKGLPKAAKGTIAKGIKGCSKLPKRGKGKRKAFHHACDQSLAPAMASKYTSTRSD